jgi:hypothetical protein
MENKIKVLLKITTEFKKNNICWGLGGSLLLYFKGITDFYNDIDIIIDEEDIKKVNTLLKALGYKNEINNKSEFYTDYYCNFTIDDVDVDVMSNFKILAKKHLYLFEFDKDYEIEYKLVNNILVPLTKVEDWLELYILMNREEKVIMINDKFKLDGDYFRKIVELK